MELQNLFILIAEDDVDDALIIKRSFEKHPAFTKIVVVRNGEELWNSLRLADAELPNIILSDINMPKLNGMEVLEKVFHDARTCIIPFFIYSSSINIIHEKKSKELGARGFLVKPFDLSEFDEIPYQIIYNLKKKHENDTDTFE